ncbi:hypothetical protein ACUNWD_20715 [Sunxiuqinia sp. A32]|uniref:hypothetical protein n=1 Tax=Sunxiuqinia sp. A32 TaxID=3461496 RepID=UPI0040456758
MKIQYTPIKKYILILLVSILPGISIAQVTSFNAVFDTISLGEQFDYLYKKSSTYEEYKVMRISGYQRIKQNSLDSIQRYKKEITTLSQEIDKFNTNLNISNSEIENLKEELVATQNSKDSIRLLGIEVSKGTYNLIMWVLLLAISAAAVILFMLYKRGHHVVTETKKRLAEVQEEFEKHRKNALTREQKLARELMDVKLKYKGR